MPIRFQDKFIEGLLEKAQQRRGKSTKAATARDLLLERLTELGYVDRHRDESSDTRNGSEPAAKPTAA